MFEKLQKTASLLLHILSAVNRYAIELSIASSGSSMKPSENGSDMKDVRSSE